MALEAIGSKEVILQLLAIHQGRNGRRPDPFKIWKNIGAYVKRGGAYHFYPLCDYDPVSPPGEFATDLVELVEEGLIRPLNGGTVEVTPLGRCFASARSLPVSLHDLEEDVVGPEPQAQITDHSVCPP
jgi:hypothetical protein